MKDYLLLLILLFFSTEMSFSQDWANLKRFQEANSKLSTYDTLQRVVFMGNSITEGWSNIRPEFFEGKPYVNRGISGQTTPQMLLRFRQDVIELKPAEKVIKLNKLMQWYAKENTLVYVDYFSAMVNSKNGLKTELGTDGVHPNALGYSIMEPLVEAGIATTLK
ncbi:hypothetical protein ACFO5O_03270 [Geojedonia litorea]|uniref:Lysophospholipase L1 n=1 Tax=Geojedonia litorea TaxID=1268269 RepID=A0ABV9N0J6_9FLAO